MIKHPPYKDAIQIHSIQKMPEPNFQNNKIFTLLSRKRICNEEKQKKKILDVI